MTPATSQPPLPRRAIALRAAAIAVPLALLLGAVVLLTYRSESILVRESLISEGQASLRLRAGTLRAHVRDVLRDVRFLASGPAVGVATVGSSGPRAEGVRLLQRVFLSLMDAKPYDQVRYLDAQGMEMVRVDRAEGFPALASTDRLQSKADRYYFKGAMALDRATIHVSHLDLNMEYDRVEEPHKPVLRFSAPVFDASGEKHGVLVINALMRDVLEETTGRSDIAGTRLMLVNNLGYWLRSPYRDDEWGGQIVSRAARTFVNDYPEAWRAMRTAAETVVSTDEGLFLSHDIRLDQPADPGPRQWGTVQGTPLGEDDYFLRLIAFVPEGVIARRLSSLRLFSLGLFGAGALAAAALSLLLAVAVERARAARQAATNRSRLLESALKDLEKAYGARRQAERKARDLSRRLESLLDAASEVSIISTDTQGVITVFNTGAENLLGYTADELLGKATPAVFHKAEEVQARSVELSWEMDRRVEGFEVFVTLPREHGSEHREWTYVRKDGSERLVDLVVTAVRDGSGAIAGFLGVAVDVTYARAAERAVRESEARLEAILKNAADGIVTVDVHGVIQSVNPAAARIFGHATADMLGRNVSMLQPEPVHSEHDGYLRRYLETGQASIIGKGREVEGRRKDGSTVPLELAVSKVRLEGGPGRETTLLFTGILRDISERKEAEAAILRAKELLEDKQRRIDRDLQAAAEIQRSLLPSASPVTGALEIDWTFRPSQHIGGDIFNLFALDEHRLGAYILDVSGHGVPSALVTVSVSQVLTPGELLTRTDRQGRSTIRRPGQVMNDLSRDFPMERFDMFFTMSYLILDTRTGQLEYCNAGHPPPLLVRAAGALEPLTEGGQLIGLGDLADPYPTGSARLEPGDMILLYTDGLTEYMNPEREQYEQQRLENVLSRMAGRHVDEVLETIMDDVTAFGQGQEPDDDISMVCIRFVQARDDKETGP